LIGRGSAMTLVEASLARLSDGILASGAPVITIVLRRCAREKRTRRASLDVPKSVERGYGGK
jgi:hypothetical protein